MLTKVTTNIGHQAEKSHFFTRRRIIRSKEEKKNPKFHYNKTCKYGGLSVMLGSPCFIQLH